MEPFLGQIMMFAGSFAPRGWAFCEGQLLAINQNTALFSLLGTQYGGDGVTNFALPDLRGRFPMHAGQGPGRPNYPQGMQGGRDSHTISAAEMPEHSHVINVSDKPGHELSPVGKVLGVATQDTYSNSTPTQQMSATTVSNTGGGQPINMMPPFTSIRFCIALEGIYPSRS